MSMSEVYIRKKLKIVQIDFARYRIILRNWNIWRSLLKLKSALFCNDCADVLVNYCIQLSQVLK